MPKKTVTVLICALNEEKNIGSLLQDIIEQNISDDISKIFDLQQILVISDGSKDKTAEIVKEFSIKDSRIRLIENQQRIGKIYSLGNAFKILETDYVVLFDADVRLEKNTISKLLEPLQNSLYDLIGGNPTPNKPESIFNLAEQASLFSWLLVQGIKHERPNSIYSAHGRILLVSKNLYKNLNIDALSTPGDDQYMYLKSNHNFYYQKDAVVFYRMPNTAEDYLKQNVRFRTAKLVRTESLDQELIKKEFEIPNKPQLFLRTLLRHPYNGMAWGILYLTGYLKFNLRATKTSSDMNKMWGEVKSTK